MRGLVGVVASINAGWQEECNEDAYGCYEGFFGVHVWVDVFKDSSIHIFDDSFCGGLI